MFFFGGTESAEDFVSYSGVDHSRLAVINVSKTRGKEDPLLLETDRLLAKGAIGQALVVEHF